MFGDKRITKGESIGETNPETSQGQNIEDIHVFKSEKRSLDKGGIRKKR